MAHTRPFRLRVLDALTAALESITPANGYEHDLTGAVFRGRDVFDENDPLPMISILEPVQQAETQMGPDGTPASKGPWQLLIQGFVQDDRLHPTDPAHFLMADVKKALGEERLRGRGFDILGMEGKVTDLIIGQGIVRPPDDISGKAYFWLFVYLNLAENVGSPYE